MIEVNGMGNACPVPVVITKKALRNNKNNEDIIVFVDNKVATENLSKMATQLHIPIEIKKISEHEYHVVLFCGSQESKNETQNNTPLAITSRYVVAINSDAIGQGDAVLGKKLVESFIFSLTEQETLPEIILFYNGGVKLTTENKKTIEDLKTLEQAGCEILSCGLCLDFYKLTDSLKIGAITNMYRIAEILRTHHVVNP